MERRCEERDLVLKTGRIKVEAARPEIWCAVLDISASGARILLPNDTEPPDIFDLTLDADGEVKLCRVVWKSGNKIGVSFQTTVAI